MSSIKSSSISRFFKDCLSKLNFASSPASLELKAPVTVSLEITSHCNSFCPGCSNVFERGKPELTTSQWQAVIAGLAPLVEEFRITGGEPTLRDDLTEILGEIEKQQKYFHIFTNGLWDDPEKKIAQFSRFGFLASFLVSLHGPDTETHEQFSPKKASGEFEKLLGTIKKLVGSGFAVSTNTVLTRANYQKVEEIAKLALSLGVRGMVFARFIGEAKPETRLNTEELKTTLDTISRLKAQGYPIELGNCFPYCFYPDLAYGCMAGITFAAISPQGEVRPCSHSPLVAGNLLSEGITPIWKSPALRKWRRKLPQNCLSCSKITFCPGGCKAQADLEGCDQLITGPVKDSTGQLLEVNLEEDLRPVLSAAQRQEDFGLILIKQQQVIPLTHKGSKLIQQLDGQLSLKQLQQKFGGSALSFIYSLYIRGMVDFKNC